MRCLSLFAKHDTGQAYWELVYGIAFVRVNNIAYELQEMRNGVDQHLNSYHIKSILFSAFHSDPHTPTDMTQACGVNLFSDLII